MEVVYLAGIQHDGSRESHLKFSPGRGSRGDQMEEMVTVMRHRYISAKRCFVDLVGDGIP